MATIAAITRSPKHLLYVLPSFGIGGVPLRIVRLINHFGNQFHYTVIALDSDFGASAHLAADCEVNLLPLLGRRRSMMSNALRNAAILWRLHPDLLITCNWGTIEWAIANRFLNIAHVHLEAGFGKEEADTQIWRRVVCRRWALAHCAKVVMPSRRLEHLARYVWKLPSDIVTYLPNGVDINRFARLSRDRIPGFVRRPGELIIGTVAPLRPEKNVGRLLRAFAMISGAIQARLIVAGDGRERDTLERLAIELGIADRVIFVGWMNPEAVLGTFDIFALSSDTEQMPNALLEAMAAGLPIAAVDVGDVKSIVAEENRRFIVPRDDQPAYAAAIECLLRDQPARRELGWRNRERVVAEFSEERMFAGYSDIIATELG